MVGRVCAGLSACSPAATVAGLLAVSTGIAVFVLASTVFEYHSTNHDEAVYLQQAAMLLEGQLELAAGPLADAFRPWFFVDDGGSLYPKYSPVPAALYAISMAFAGEPRVTLAVVAGANTGLVYLLGAAVADRRVGVVAALLFALSPMMLLTSATFLPYAPTTLFNLVFAVAYLRGHRTGARRWAVVAGVATGLAFFARPYTAVLFALPFVAHAGYTVLTALSRDGLRPLPDPAVRQALTAVFGLGFVALTLAYNARLTGDPLLFPYEAFAPMDGPGFGRRRILGHSIEYTPGVALEANGYVLWYLLTRWIAGGLLGAGLALTGVGVLLTAWRRQSAGDAGESSTDGGSSTESELGCTPGFLLAGLFVTVPLGNLFFWGNYNVLATLSDPTNGLVSQFGPFYHFDLLAPIAVFGALALVAGCRRFAPALASGLGGRPARASLVGLVATLLLVGAVSTVLVATPLERNAAHTEKYEQAYEPIESATFENDLVFVPTPYGDWQNHPFQVLRNDPEFDGPVVYALDREPAGDFEVIDAYPDRDVHRYTYRGEWTPDADERVQPKLEPLSVRRGETLDAEAVVGVPDNVASAQVRLLTESDDRIGYNIPDPGETVTVSWSLDADGATLTQVSESVSLAETDTAVLRITLVQPDGSTLTYRQEATVRTTGDTVEVVWPPERTVCPLTTDCGRDGTYLPDRPEIQFDGVFFDVRIESAE
jgi:hypothetical protein